MKTYQYSATVSAVIDGDTIRASLDLGFGFWFKDQTFRLAGINAPEMHGDTAERGRASKTYLENKVLNKKIIIETVLDKKEKYGRYLARLIVDDIDINKDLVANGLAVFKTY